MSIMKTEPRIYTAYSSHLYSEGFGERILKMAGVVEQAQKKYNFDAMVFRGTSGVALAPAIFAFTGIPMLHARKHDGSHAGAICEGYRGRYPVSMRDPDPPPPSYAFIDDFISSGATLDECIEMLARDVPGAKIVCAILASNGAGYNEYQEIPVIYNAMGF